MTEVTYNPDTLNLGDSALIAIFEYAAQTELPGRKGQAPPEEIRRVVRLRKFDRDVAFERLKEQTRQFITFITPAVKLGLVEVSPRTIPLFMKGILQYERSKVGQNGPLRVLVERMVNEIKPETPVK